MVAVRCTFDLDLIQGGIKKTPNNRFFSASSKPYLPTLDANVDFGFPYTVFSKLNSYNDSLNYNSKVVTKGAVSIFTEVHKFKVRNYVKYPNILC